MQRPAHLIVAGCVAAAVAAAEWLHGRRRRPGVGGGGAVPPPRSPERCAGRDACPRSGPRWPPCCSAGAGGWGGAGVADRVPLACAAGAAGDACLATTRLPRSGAVAAAPAADEGALAAALPRTASFDRLARATHGSPRTERGIVTFSGSGEPWAWAGRHRFAVPAIDTTELRAVITSFYVSLEAHARRPGSSSVGTVLLMPHPPFQTAAAPSVTPSRPRAASNCAFSRPGSRRRDPTCSTTRPPAGIRSSAC